ncbi:MAG TPA: hypothetical protein VLJ68_04540 [Chitinophagaceae bacterium]|nr:hypothetical protein [Chitinophagaceae bacterium]
MAILPILSYSQIPVEQPNFSNLRQKSFKITADTIRIDSVSIVPGSLSVNNIPAADYRIDFAKAILYWKKKPAQETVGCTYRVFPFSFSRIRQRMSYDSVMNNFYVTPFTFDKGELNGQRGVFDFGSLKAEGSFGRQIGFGNSQDAVLNSTLNLQLSGMLADSLEIQAAITDNNIPIQPDGTTQQLNEFDQVYMQFKKRNWQVNLGDIDIRQDQAYFLRFYKRLQGISFQTNNRLSRSLESRSLGSVSIAKGKFTRNVRQGLEGNQGPYRLTGANNEFFFIVLANTERVFLDGALLQRGEDQDYVINYNTAEVTFTPRHMITKDSRIQVEFEYADRNYLNANLYFSQEIEVNKKFLLRLGVFNNGDARNSPINQYLDAKQKQFLSNLGDSINKAYYPSATIDSLTAGKILYEKLYYVPGPGPAQDSFYKYSINSSTAIYSLSFTELGPGNGNYVPDFNGANGKVFKFIAPVAGVKQGSFEPVQVLVTPKKQQLVSLGMDYHISKNTLLKTEVATSKMDLNTFSAKDNGDDRGWAAKAQLSHEKYFGTPKKLALLTSIDYEYVQDKFRPLERLRAVEFSRDWGLPILVQSATENLLKFSAGIRDKDNQSLSYQFINYHRSDHYHGTQHTLSQSSNWKGWMLNNQFVLTGFDALLDKGTFLRPIADLSKQFRKLNNWRLGFGYALERNAVRNKNTDTLGFTSFYFDSYSIYIRSDETKKDHFGITFFTRTDQYPVMKEFRKGDRSLNLNLQAELLSNPNRQLYLNTTFRKLKNLDSNVSKQKSDESILGRVEYVMNEWKGLLNGNILYEVGAGQEQRRDFAYLEVPQGTGQYAWIDYNSDGVQQLNEFELAAFPDQARFIRIFTPTNEFIKANYITFNYSFQVSPRAAMVPSAIKGFNKFLARLSFVTSLQINKKSIAKGDYEFNPFKYGVSDTALITLGTTVLNSLSFNRYSSKWGFDLSNLRSNGKSLLTYGYESRRLHTWMLKCRINLNPRVSLVTNGRVGENALFTPQFGNRNYDLNIFNAEEQVIFIRGTVFRFLASYKLDIRKNKPVYGGERSVSNSLNIESKYNILQNSSLTGKFTFNNIGYDFPANTTVSYIMLDGLLPGKNFLWSLGLSKRLLNNIELNVQYDGRKAGVSRTVHVGRVGLTALF